MKSIAFILLVSIILVAEGSLFSQLNKALGKYAGMENLQKRSLQKRDVQYCDRTTCLTQGQSCTPPNTTALCGNCTSVTQCMIAGNGINNRTAACICYRNAISCLQRTGGACLTINLQQPCQNYGGNTCDCSVQNPVYYDSFQCPYNLQCENDTTCLPRPLLGQHCIGIDSCGEDDLLGGITYANGLTCPSTTHVCTRVPGTVEIGDPCGNTTDCIGGDTVPAKTSCTGGLCVGVAVNAACSSTNECAYGLYCKNSACVPQLAANASCNILDDSPCSDSYTCSKEGTCIPMFSKPLGTACEPDDSGLPDRNECVLGTYCAKFSRTCLAPIAPTTCNPLANVSTCPNGTECNCDNGSFKCSGSDSLLAYVDPACKANFLALSGCLAGAKCKGATAKGGCGDRYCYNEFQCLWKCYFTSIRANYPLSLGCVTTPTFNCTVPSVTTGSDSTSSGYALQLCLAMIVALVLATL